MAVVFNATASHPQANSYISLVEADQYFENRDNSSAWTAATDDQKKQSLIEGTRRVDSNRFKFQTLKDEQSLEFPRDRGKFARTFSSNIQSVTANTITDSSLTGLTSMPDDYWRYGAISFTQSGQDNFLDIKEVSDFVASTGVLTTTENFATTPSDGDGYELIREVPREIKYAVCETGVAVIEDALNVVADPNVKRQQLGDEEIEYFDKSSRTASIPSLARQLIAPYVSRMGSVRSVSKFR